jgi:hypothetical protein
MPHRFGLHGRIGESGASWAIHAALHALRGLVGQAQVAIKLVEPRHR